MSLESLKGRGIHLDFWKDAVYIDGYLNIDDLKKLVAHIEQHGYKEVEDSDSV